MITTNKAGHLANLTKNHNLPIMREIFVLIKNSAVILFIPRLLPLLRNHERIELSKHSAKNYQPHAPEAILTNTNEVTTGSVTGGGSHLPKLIANNIF